MKNPDSPDPPPVPRLPLRQILSAISSGVRCHILRELATRGPLPVHELARTLRSTPSAISKHFNVLRASGIVQRGFGCLYSIDPRFLVDQHTLDLGAVVVRLDRVR